VSSILQRLGEMGIELPPRRSAGQYVGAVRSGNLVFVSGAGPLGPDGMISGKLGGEVDLETGREAARLCAIGCLSALQEELGQLDYISRVVKVLGFVNSAPGFRQQPQVVDGASEFLLSLFGDRGAHARSAVGVAELPFGIAVEVEMVVEVSGP
jgi:enamine deaminase RidA (YjgF/YER057c/UK114 family)